MALASAGSWGLPKTVPSTTTMVSAERMRSAGCAFATARALASETRMTSSSGGRSGFMVSSMSAVWI